MFTKFGNSRLVVISAFPLEKWTTTQNRNGTTEEIKNTQGSTRHPQSIQDESSYKGPRPNPVNRHGSKSMRLPLVWRQESPELTVAYRTGSNSKPSLWTWKSLVWHNTTVLSVPSSHIPTLAIRTETKFTTLIGTLRLTMPSGRIGEPKFTSVG